MNMNIERLTSTYVEIEMLFTSMSIKWIAQTSQVGQIRSLSVNFQSFQLNFMQFYKKLMWKMSIQYLAPGFKLIAFWLWVSSINH